MMSWYFYFTENKIISQLNLTTWFRVKRIANSVSYKTLRPLPSPQSPARYVVTWVEGHRESSHRSLRSHSSLVTSFRWHLLAHSQSPLALRTTEKHKERLWRWQLEHYLWLNLRELQVKQALAHRCTREYCMVAVQRADQDQSNLFLQNAICYKHDIVFWAQPHMMLSTWWKDSNPTSLHFLKINRRKQYLAYRKREAEPSTRHWTSSWPTCDLTFKK